VVEGKDYVPLLPLEMRDTPPELVERIPPNIGDEEFGMELGGAGTALWCRIAGRWELGTLRGTQKANLVVNIEGTDHMVEPRDATRFEPSHAQDLPNMVQMHNLHEAPLLYLLQRRLKNGSIYTWAGDVLLSLNPYAPLPDVYNMSRWQTDRTPQHGAQRRPGAAAPPHVYAIARRAYSQMRAAMELPEAERAAAAASGLYADQSVLISGESGAGKTEASKRVIEFLTSASRTAKEARSTGAGSGTGATAGGAGPCTDSSGAGTSEGSWHCKAGAGDGSVHGKAGAAEGALHAKAAGEGSWPSKSRTPAKRSAPREGGFTPSVGVSGTSDGAPVAIESLLKEASPILEAFGNAKTIRNDNSSRFGKYVAVEYDAHGCIAGAATETYLLERSRVVDISEGERNYHIFYQMLTDNSIREAWDLPGAEELEALSVRGVTATLTGVSDAKEFAAVKKALPAFGVGLEAQAAVWRILAAVLWLRNVRFEQAEDAGGGSDDHAQLADEGPLARVAAALGCEAEPLRSALLKKKISVAGELIEQRYSTKAAQVGEYPPYASVSLTLFFCYIHTLATHTFLHASLHPSFFIHT
jgi:myosin heavy subunit